MTTDSDPRVDLDASMFMDIAEMFIANMEANGFTDCDDRAVVYAGFLSCITGQMCRSTGVENTQMVLDAVKKGAAGAVRSTLRVVKT